MKEQGEFKFTQKDFDHLRKLVTQHSGITLSDAKKSLVYGRLARRLRKLGLTSFKEYCQILDGGDEEELSNFINAITTNLTSFFRENHHFDFLNKKLLPAYKQNNSSRRLRIWSAGCSTGEEPYSIAATLYDFFKADTGWDIKILATDLDTNVVAHGKAGIYNEKTIEDLSSQQRQRWFKKGTGTNEGMYRVIPEIRQMITFRPLNLMREWPMKNQFDIIFCRNVVIYFDKEAKKKLFERYANIMPDDGYLFIGHSENLFRTSDRFDSIGHTIYQKKY